MRTYIALVIDQSGSMTPVRDVTLQGINKEIKTIKGNVINGNEIYVSLFTFNHRVHDIFLNCRPDEIQELTEADYVPSGTTALYDAIKHAIMKLQDSCSVDPNASLVDQYNALNTSFLVNVFTDGEENSSSTTAESLSSLIKELEDTGHWTFTVIGADIDLKKLASTLNLKHVTAYQPTVDGTRLAFDIMCSATASYLRTGSIYDGRFYDGTFPLFLEGDSGWKDNHNKV